MSRTERLARARIEALRAAHPGRYQLARRVSIAARVDQPFLRAVRVELVPEAGVEDEIELWFGPLVENASSQGFVFLPEVAEQLRNSLRGDPPLVWAIHRLLARSHRHLAPVVRLEERLTAETLAGQPAEHLERILSPAVRGLLNPQRGALSRWVARALPRLPPEVQGLRGAEALQERALVISETAGLNGGGVEDWRAALHLEPDQEVEAWVCLSGAGLEIGLEPDRREHARALSVAKATPQLLQVAWQAEDREHTRLLHLTRGAPLRIAGLDSSATLRFADGQSVVVRAEDPDAVAADQRYRLAKVALFWPDGEPQELPSLVDARATGRSRAQPVFLARLPVRERESEDQPLVRDVALWPMSRERPASELLLHQASALVVARTLEGGEADDVVALLDELQQLSEDRRAPLPPILLAGMAEGHYHLDIEITHKALLELAAEYDLSYEPHADQPGMLAAALARIIDWDRGVGAYVDAKHFDAHRDLLPDLADDGAGAVPVERLYRRFDAALEDPLAPQIDALLAISERLGEVYRVASGDGQGDWVVARDMLERVVFELLPGQGQGRQMPIVEREALLDTIAKEVLSMASDVDGTRVADLSRDLVARLEALGLLFSFESRDGQGFVGVPGRVLGEPILEGVA